MTAENEARGRSNRAKGNEWMRRCVRALRANGFPHADIIPSHGRSDIGGVGDLAIECKNEATWAHLSASLEQVDRDALWRDLPMGIVWRKRHGWADPMDGHIVITPRKWWEHWTEHQRLEAVELEFAAWRAGLAAAAQAREAAG